MGRRGGGLLGLVVVKFNFGRKRERERERDGSNGMEFGMLILFDHV